MMRLSTRGLVEEFCALGVWPLAQGWSVELGDPRDGLPTITVTGREGFGLCLELFVHAFLPFIYLFLF